MRLYLDPLLSAYVDVENGSILYAEPLPKAQSPFGGYYVWLKRHQDLLRDLQEGYQRSAQTLQEVSNGAQSNAPLFSSLPSGWPGSSPTF